MGERRAYVCRHKDHEKSAYRVFLAEPGPVPKCPEHGRPMERDTNNPYFGKPVPTTPAVVRKGAKE